MPAYTALYGLCCYTLKFCINVDTMNKNVPKETFWRVRYCRRFVNVCYFNKKYTGVLSTSFYFFFKKLFKKKTFFSYETVFNNPTARFLEKVNSSILKTYSLPNK